MYLLDTSAWTQAPLSDVAADRLTAEIRSGSIALCTVTALEILYSSRNSRDYRRTLEELTSMPWRELRDPRGALPVQLALADRGQHRTSVPDVIVAATAAEHNLTVLHYDGDFERLAAVAGIEHEWIIPRGRGHSRGKG